MQVSTSTKPRAWSSCSISETSHTWPPLRTVRSARRAAPAWSVGTESRPTTRWPFGAKAAARRSSATSPTRRGRNGAGSHASVYAARSSSCVTSCARISMRAAWGLAATFARANAKDGSQMSMPTTRNDGHSSAASSAMPPTPVPTSRKQPASDAAKVGRLAASATILRTFWREERPRPCSVSGS